MAIIQISRIIQRSGNLVDLPQLAEAELGWANDARRLFVGRGAPYDAENVEVLTSYSSISFGQLEGSYGNLDFITPVEGQIVTYNASANTWVNTGGNAADPGNTSQYSNNLVHLGDVGNVKLGGGSIGYVLETDGQGNLAWASKGTLRNPIFAISNATPVVIQIEPTTPYVNGLEITITGANATNANAILNGQNFYVDLAPDFSISGNVSLYTDLGLSNAVNGSTLSSYVSNSGVATALLASSTSGAVAGGIEGSIQFNKSGFANGGAALVWNTTTSLLAVTGNSNISGTSTVGALSATGVVTGSQIISTVANPTPPLIVTSSTRIANANVQTAGNLINGTSNVIVNANSNIAMSVGNNANILVVTTSGTSVSGTLSVSGNANVSNIGATNGVFTNVSGNGSALTGISSSNISGQVANALVSGTVYTNAQPNITSVGTLTTLSVSGNANVGNLSVTGYANINGATIISGNTGLPVATGSNPIITGKLGTPNIGKLYIGDGTGWNFKLATRVSSTDTDRVTFYDNGNVAFTGALTGITSLSTTGTTTVGNISTTGNITANNISIGNVETVGVFTRYSKVTFLDNANVVAGNRLIVTMPAPATVNGMYSGVLKVYTTRQFDNSGGPRSHTTFKLSRVGNISGANATFYVNEAVVDKTSAFAYQWYFDSATGTPSLVIGQNSNSYNWYVESELDTSTIPTITIGSNAGSYGTAYYPLYTLATPGTDSGGLTVTASNSSNTMVFDSNGQLSLAGNITAGNITLANASIIRANNMQLTTGANTNPGNITGNWTLTTGSRLQATYADLAEYYEADADYEPGTVLEFGGEKEVTLAQGMTPRVAGVVSTNPAYIMNSTCQGIAVAIALQGRVPTKVRGAIRKGDMIVSAGNGYATSSLEPKIGTIIGKALENFDGIEGVIEVAVGRL